jgi:hypothetical protein
MAKARKIPSEKAISTTLSKQMQMALASLRLENITLPPEALADLKLVEEGKLTEEEAIKRMLARVTK